MTVWSQVTVNGALVDRIVLQGHLDENQVREELESEIGDKIHVERLMSRGITHTYGKRIPNGSWWLTHDPRPRQRTTPLTLIL